MVVAHLDITCWAYSVGGEHYIGSIKFSGWNSDVTVIKVEHPLTEREAFYLNKKDGTASFSRYRPGELSDRYENREQLVRDATKLFLSKYQGILIDGFFGSASPAPVICASKGLEKELRFLRKLHAQWEKLGGYDKGNDKKTERIDNWWWRTIQRIKHAEQCTT